MYEIEKEIRSYIPNKLSNSAILKASIENNIIQHFRNKNILLKLCDHSEETHASNLIQNIVKKYFNIRLSYMCKTMKEHSEYIRNFCTKLIIHKGQ